MLLPLIIQIVAVALTLAAAWRVTTGLGLGRDVAERWVFAGMVWLALVVGMMTLLGLVRRLVPVWLLAAAVLLFLATLPLRGGWVMTEE